MAESTLKCIDQPNWVSTQIPGQSYEHQQVGRARSRSGPGSREVLQVNSKLLTRIKAVYTPFGSTAWPFLAFSRRQTASRHHVSSSRSLQSLSFSRDAAPPPQAELWQTQASPDEPQTSLKAIPSRPRALYKHDPSRLPFRYQQIAANQWLSGRIHSNHRWFTSYYHGNCEAKVSFMSYSGGS